ncbi:hypothetical protein CH333_04295 [candidate division WOR-3 bacterium JGI_Cruoil_03_44_89]|uniref:Radical SAM core domain-containing protein n=1 Tax=candidate division WOR-3 bacterium JGI_Cruoil_03_44_89 TaxID=1973748 RepID=A0A235BV56_UNCW3|nr:MAG: hypothetical protein CH333_04295 [candidate division WOR-3 bacterium JGI_Cruoil_03_44_89]
MWVVSKRKFDVNRLRFLLENSFSTKLIKIALQTDETGKTHLETLLDSYGGNKRMSPAIRIKLYPIIKVLDIIRRSFGRDMEAFKKDLKDPVIRKIALNSFNSLLTYGLSTPQNFYMPLMVVWNFTNNCNLRCKHCYQNAGPGGEKRDELTTEEKMRVVDELHKSNVVTIYFSGGEPLFAPDFFDVAEYAKKKGFYLSVATNGTLLTEKNVKRIKDIGFGYIAASLDASTPEKHDAFRGVPGMWERTYEGIKRLIKAGVTTCIQFTLAKENFDELPKMLDLREKLGAYKLIVYNYIPVGKAGFENDPTPEQKEEALRIMYEELNAGYHVVASTAPQLGRYCKERNADSVVIAHYADVKGKELSTIADIVGGCGAGRVYCAVQPDGLVTPCVYMPHLVAGNLRKQSFKEIWQESPLMVYLRDKSELKEACNSCEYNAVCGGCRARAYEYTGDLMGPDPGCTKNKDVYYSLIEELKEAGKEKRKAVAGVK